MDLGPSTTSTLVVVALGVSVVALIIAVLGYRRLAGMQVRYRLLWAGGEKDLIALLSHQSAQIAELHGEVDLIRAQVTLTPPEQQAIAAAHYGKGAE